MSNSGKSKELHFEPPGPGSWKQDPVHFPRPLTRYWQEMHPPAFKKGTNDFARFYGLLIDGLQMAYVNGIGYRQVLPVPEAEIPERFKRAEQVFAQKLWREQLREWDEKSKPSAIATHRELQAVNPDTLSDSELVAYLKRCRDHHSAMIAQHMRFTAGATDPNRGFPRTCCGVDGLAAVRVAGLDARFGRGIGGRLRRDAAPEAGIRQGRRGPQEPRIQWRPRTGARRLAFPWGRNRRGNLRLSRPGGQPAH